MRLSGCFILLHVSLCFDIFLRRYFARFSFHCNMHSEFHQYLFHFKLYSNSYTAPVIRGFCYYVHLDPVNVKNVQATITNSSESPSKILISRIDWWSVAPWVSIFRQPSHVFMYTYEPKYNIDTALKL